MAAVHQLTLKAKQSSRRVAYVSYVPYCFLNLFWLSERVTRPALLTVQKMSATGGMKVADPSTGKSEVYDFENKMSFNFFKILSAYLRRPVSCHALTEHSALQSDDAHRLQAARSARSISAQSSVQVAGVSFGNTEIDFF